MEINCELYLKAVPRTYQYFCLLDFMPCGTKLEKRVNSIHGDGCGMMYMAGVNEITFDEVMRVIRPSFCVLKM
jgi:hypothetical protein